MALAIVAGAAAVFAAWRRRARVRAVRAWRAAWGRPRQRDRPMALVAEYHRVRCTASGVAGLDDRTCDDLHVDAIFAHLDRTESAIGQQVLYDRLRRTPSAEPLEAFEALVTRLSDDPDARDRLHGALSPLRDTAAYHLAAVAEVAPRPRRWHLVFPILAGVMLLALAAAPFWPVAMLAAICGVVVHFVVRMALAGQTGAALALFRQVAPLLHAADAVAALHGPDTTPILGGLDGARLRLRRLRVFARWAGGDPGGSELVDAIVQYFNVVFLLDANAFYFGAHELRRCGDALLTVIGAVGEVDAAMAVASFRAGTAGWTRPRFGPPGSPVRLDAVRHPLIEGAIANDIVLAPPAGLLLTGANMSGKSTLLRTVGINVVLAQTIHTCLCASYAAPVLQVRSLLGRADDLVAGKSYYRVEVEAVVAMLAAARSTQPHLFLFDELFRGTNTIERIAAGAAVLKQLGRDVPGAARHVVVVATHDRELVELLADRYQSAHLGDGIGTNGIAFDYRLRQGPATTRNAIALLKLTGAPDAVVDDARSLAAALDERRAGPPHDRQPAREAAPEPQAPI